MKKISDKAGKAAIKTATAYSKQIAIEKAKKAGKATKVAAKSVSKKVGAFFSNLGK